MADNFDLDAALGSKPKGDHFDLDSVLSAGKPQASGLGSPMDTLSGAWEVLNPLNIAKSTIGMAMSPIQTAKGMLDAQTLEAVKAYDAAKAGNLPEASMHAGSALIPVSGPMSQAVGDEMRQPGQFYKGLGKGLGMTALTFAPEIGAKTKGALKPIANKAGQLAQEGAVKSYEQVLGATTKDNKRMASQLVPELVDRGVMAPTRKSLYEKFRASAEDTGAKLDDALANVPEDLKVDVAKAQAKLEKLKDQHLVKSQNGTTAPANDAAASAIEAINSLQMDMKNLDPSFGSVRKFRQILDRQVTAGNKAFGRTIREGSTLDVTREGANAIRSVLAEADPNVAALNKELSFWLKAKDVLGATIERTASQAKPLSKTIAEGAVAAGELASGGGLVSAGIKAKMIGTVTGLVNSTGWRTASATLKGKIAKALMNGDEAALARESLAIKGRREDSAPAAVEAPPAPEQPAAAQPAEVGGMHPGYKALIDSVKGKTQAEAMKILAEQEVSSFLAPGILERAGIKAPVGDVVTRSHPGQASPAFVDERLGYLQEQAAKRGSAPEQFKAQVEANKGKGAELAAALEQPEAPKPTARQQGEALHAKAKARAKKGSK